jgi:hypothetical protein
VTEEAAKEKLGDGSLSGEAHGTSGELHARTNTHAIHTSSLSLSPLSPFFSGYVSPKREIKFKNSKMKW